MPRKSEPIAPGTRYGQFVCIKEGEAYWTPDGRYRRRQVEVHCDDCGQDTILRLDHLRNGDAICEYCSGKTPLPSSGVSSLQSALGSILGFGAKPTLPVPGSQRPVAPSKPVASSSSVPTPRAAPSVPASPPGRPVLNRVPGSEATPAEVEAFKRMQGNVGAMPVGFEDLASLARYGRTLPHANEDGHALTWIEYDRGWTRSNLQWKRFR